MLRVYEGHPAALITEHPLSLHQHTDTGSLRRLKQRWVYVELTPSTTWQAWTNQGVQGYLDCLASSTDLTTVLREVNSYCTKHSIASRNDLNFLGYTLRWERDHGTQSN